jgi:hypothetical protein
MTSSSLELSIIWVVYAVVVAFLLVLASIFISVSQTPRDRSPAVTIVCILTVTALFATILLQPVDIALVSSTVVSKLGHRKDWATQDEVDEITHSLTIVYYVLYALDALLCLLVIPFTYFWYEEYDEIAAEERKQCLSRRLWGSFKYTLAFAILTAILFIVGFFVPIPKKGEYGNELDYLKRFLTENRMSSVFCFAHLVMHLQVLTCCRWRACFDLCTGHPDNPWHPALYPLHIGWLRNTPGFFHQDYPFDFQSIPEGKHCGATRSKSTEATPTRMSMWRKHCKFII